MLVQLTVFNRLLTFQFCKEAVGHQAVTEAACIFRNWAWY